MDTVTIKAGDRMSITVNLNRFLDDILPEKISQGLELAGQYVENTAKENITNMGAVDTGALKNSITHVVGDKAVEIGTSVEYSHFVHDGTSKMEGRPFLQNAVDEHMMEIVEYFKRGAEF
ncbi:MAG: HK97-gp10 family putative phage morphogenesis protein [Anaerotignaceae bacterium]